MEDNFALTWEDPATVVQSEEVICSIENEILPDESEEFTGVVCNEQTAETTTTIEQNVGEHEEYEEETEEIVNDGVQEEVEEQIEEVEEDVGEVEEVVMGDDQQIVQEVVETVNNETEVVHQENIVYLTDDNVIVMQSDVVADEIMEEIPITTNNNNSDTITTNDNDFQQHFMDCQVSEEIVTEQQWDESCPEEIVVGSEEAVGGTEEQTNEDFDIPLPTDQDEYTASRPYPCDFCSRRFRKKANLMNHMVAHQTDRPHGCNLCGVRYIRRCDLMNHLKIHAYVPETDGIEEEETQQFDESDQEKRNNSSGSIINNNKKLRSFGKRNKKKIKDEYDNNYENDETGASSSKSYNYVDEDMRLMEAMQNNVKTDYNEYNEYMTENQTVEVRYPITDPRKPFVCQHCGVGFAREKALASHARIHGGDSPFECQKCGEMFWDLALMREHIRTKHGGDIDDLIDENDVDDDNDEDDDYSDEETKYGTFYCSVCGLSFHRQDNLKRHQRVHIKEEYVNDHEFGHICNVCGESFPEALDLLAHAEIHARTSEHRCMICGELCNDDQSVAVHVQTKHGKNLPPNTCMLCGRTCKDRRTLLKHSWEHSKEKSFACSKCAKTFHNKARLKRHMLSHRNKVVSCDVCGEEFPDGRSLMNHRHSHSSLTGRQFPCRECGKTFGSRSSQQIHIRIHTGERPYGCRFCWKAFADGGTLRKHERIHTGEKPYACAVCPRAFNQRVVLREHIRSHHSGPDPKYSHSVTPYCCSVCSDMFATSQDLIVHLIHHCDMNTAMKRQPQVGPRKYKRRRKLKPHELEMISNKVDDEMEDDDDQQQQYNQQQDPQQQQQQNIYSDSEDDRETRRKSSKKTKKYSPKSSLSESYNDFYNSCTSTIENINSIVNSKTTTTTPVKTKRKIKNESSTGGATTTTTTTTASTTPVPSRPKMIHTQKTRVPVETGEDGKVRHKTKTLITRTQPTELKSSTGERIRPRTKNVSYHILNNEKLPIATFPEDDQAVNNLLKEELNVNNEQNISNTNNNNNGDIIMEQQTEQTPEVASEQIVESDNGAFPTNIIKVTSTPTQLHNLRPGRHLIVPYNKVRLVKGGMIVTKTKEKEKRNNNEPENILPDVDAEDGGGGGGGGSNNNDKGLGKIKQEIVDPSPLHELAEISMQHAQNIFKCEMCSAVFSDRGKLLDHVPIHI